MKTKKYKITKGLILQKLENKTVVFDSDESVLYTFNETASFIFSKLKLGWDEEKISQGLLKKYKVTRINAKKDIKELINKLGKKMIIKKLK